MSEDYDPEAIENWEDEYPHDGVSIHVEGTPDIDTWVPVLYVHGTFVDGEEVDILSGDVYFSPHRGTLGINAEETRPHENAGTLPPETAAFLAGPEF
jgi:hypothetical protein